jgi:hypothetical protein
MGTERGVRYMGVDACNSGQNQDVPYYIQYRKDVFQGRLRLCDLIEAVILNPKLRGAKRVEVQYSGLSTNGRPSHMSICPGLDRQYCTVLYCVYNTY